MSAPKSFKIYEKKHASGNIGYRVDLGLVNGKRAFKHFSTLEKAEAARKKLLKEQAARNPLLLSDIDASTRHEVLLALERLRDYRATVTEAVDFFLKHARPAKADATIGQVMEEFKSVKTKAGLSKKYLDTAWKSFFVPFRDTFKNCIITEVTSDAVENYIYKRKSWNSTTRATVIRHLNVLFNFAIERGYAALNPFSAVQKPKRAANNSKEKVLTVEQVIKLLQYAYKNDYKRECAALVLVFFCGVRVDEVTRLTLGLPSRTASVTSALNRSTCGLRLYIAITSAVPSERTRQLRGSLCQPAVVVPSALRINQAFARSAFGLVSGHVQTVPASLDSSEVLGAGSLGLAVAFDWARAQVAVNTRTNGRTKSRVGTWVDMPLNAPLNEHPQARSPVGSALLPEHAFSTQCHRPTNPRDSGTT